MILFVLRRARTEARLDFRVLTLLVVAVGLAGCDANTTTAPRPTSASSNGKNAPVRITPATDTLDALGSSAQLAASGDVTWSSLTPDVVTVDGNGTVTAAGRGLGLIRAVSAGGKKADTATILVRQLAAAVHASPDLVRLTALPPPFPPQTAELTATVEDANGHPIVDAVVTWVSDALDVAVVSAEGLVTAIGAGVTTVRVILDQLSDTTVVNISPAPST